MSRKGRGRTGRGSRVVSYKVQECLVKEVDGLGEEEGGLR